MRSSQLSVELSRRQMLPRIYRLAIAPDFEMQSRLSFRPLPHGRYALAFLDFLPFFDQQRRVVPVGTQVGVVVLENNKLTVADQSTARVDHMARRRSVDGLTLFTVDQDTGATSRFCAKSDVDTAIRRP